MIQRDPVWIWQTPRTCGRRRLFELLGGSPPLPGDPAPFPSLRPRRPTCRGTRGGRRMGRTSLVCPWPLHAHRPRACPLDGAPPVLSLPPPPVALCVVWPPRQWAEVGVGSILGPRLLFKFLRTGKSYSRSGPAPRALSPGLTRSRRAGGRAGGKWKRRRAPRGTEARVSGAPDSTPHSSSCSCPSPTSHLRAERYPVQ